MSRQSNGDLRKPWHRDAHLAKLDLWVLPVVKKRQWTVVELADYFREKGMSEFLSVGLLERWLVYAAERGLVEQCANPETGMATARWTVTERGFAVEGRLGNRVLERLGGLSGVVGISSFFIGIAADRLGAGLQPLAWLAFFLSFVALVGFVIGGSLAERSRLLLRKVAEREALVEEHREKQNDVVEAGP